jgi:hypothetical protein
MSSRTEPTTITARRSRWWLCWARRVLVGWAADGFPVYVQEALRPSWRLKKERDAGGPGGTSDGTYSRDHEYIRGLGDLDECNGREGTTAQFPEGTYYYVVTDKFPHVPRCFVGTADASFVKQGGPPPGRRPPGPPPFGGPSRSSRLLAGPGESR